MNTLFRRIVAVLLASCLVGDPSTCQAFSSFPLPSAHTAVDQTTAFTDQALTLRLTSYFKGWGGRAATLAGFHEMQNFAEAQDLEISPDGTAVIRPFDFGPLFSKRTRDKEVDRQHHRIDHIVELLAEVGDTSSMKLTIRQEQVLEQIQEGVRSQVQIAAYLGVTPPSIPRYINLLIRKLQTERTRRAGLTADHLNDAQIVEALRTRSLATSQNAIGADVGGDVVHRNSPEKILHLWLQGAYPDTFGREGGDVPYWLDGFWEEVTSKPVDWQEKPELSAILQRLFEWRLQENGAQKQIAQELKISVNRVRTYESLIRHTLRLKALAYRDRAHPEAVLAKPLDTLEFPYWPTQRIKTFGMTTNRDLVRRIKANTFPVNAFTKKMNAMIIGIVRQRGYLDLPDATAPLDPLDHSIEILGLLSRANFGLTHPERPVNTLRELVRLSEYDLRRPPYNMTVRSVREVKAQLALMGLKLADNPSSTGLGLTKDLFGFMALSYVGGIESAKWIGAASGMPLLGVAFGTAVPLVLGVILFKAFFPSMARSRRPVSEFLRAA